MDHLWKALTLVFKKDTQKQEPTTELGKIFKNHFVVGINPSLVVKSLFLFFTTFLVFTPLSIVQNLFVNWARSWVLFYGELYLSKFAYQWLITSGFSNLRLALSVSYLVKYPLRRWVRGKGSHSEDSMVTYLVEGFITNYLLSFMCHELLRHFEADNLRTHGYLLTKALLITTFYPAGLYANGLSSVIRFLDMLRYMIYLLIFYEFLGINRMQLNIATYDYLGLNYLGFGKLFQFSEAIPVGFKLNGNYLLYRLASPTPMMSLLDILILVTVLEVGFFAPLKQLLKRINVLLRQLDGSQFTKEQIYLKLLTHPLVGNSFRKMEQLKPLWQQFFSMLRPQELRFQNIIGTLTMTLWTLLRTLFRLMVPDVFDYEEGYSVLEEIFKCIKQFQLGRTLLVILSWFLYDVSHLYYWLYLLPVLTSLRALLSLSYAFNLGLLPLLNIHSKGVDSRPIALWVQAIVGFMFFLMFSFFIHLSYIDLQFFFLLSIIYLSGLALNLSDRIWLYLTANYFCKILEFIKTQLGYSKILDHSWNYKSDLLFSQVYYELVALYGSLDLSYMFFRQIHANFTAPDQLSLRLFYWPYTIAHMIPVFNSQPKEPNYYLSR